MSTPFNPDWLNPGAAVEVSIDTIAAYHSEVLRLRAALAGQECPNCASLQDQNTELDRKLAELERKNDLP